jgi:hypothetical protein
MTWDQAKKACEAFGDNWRLANSFEMGIVFQNAKTDNSYKYWVSDQINLSMANKRDSTYYYNVLESNDRLTWIFPKNEFGNVRAVRGSYRPASDLNKIIGLPIKIGNMLIAEHDFHKPMNWYNAKIGCNSLGEGWRLPNFEEVKLLKTNSEKIGLKKNGYLNYWTNINYHSDSTYSFNVDNPENRLLSSFDQDLSTRCIKVVYNNNFKNKIIGNTFRFGDLEIAQFDFPKEITWKEALIECAKLGDGWRLPYYDEFRFILTLDRYTIVKMDLNGSAYWTFDGDQDSRPFYSCDCFDCCCDDLYGHNEDEIPEDEQEEIYNSAQIFVRAVRNY